MTQHRCPGQNSQFWGPNDIFAIPCPDCGKGIEFFKDDAKRECPACGRLVFNPRVNAGCALWCPKAEDCLGPEQYASLTAIQETAARRKADMELLLTLVPPKEDDVRRLFKKLYIENRDPVRLIDTDRLQQVRDDDPDLFERATRYFRKFTDRARSQPE